MCVQIWLLVWEAGEKEFWVCRTSFPGSPIPVLLKSTHQGFLLFSPFCYFYGAKDKVSRNELKAAPQRMDNVSFGSFRWNHTSQALVWKQQKWFLSWWRRRTFPATLRAGGRTRMAKQQQTNSFSQNSLPMRSSRCYELEGKEPFPTWSPAFNWHHLFLLASAVHIFGLFCICLC